MPKLVLCAPVLNQILRQFWGEVKNSFIILPSKGVAAGSCLKLCVPTQKSLVRTFIATVQGLSADKDQSM